MTITKEWKWKLGLNGHVALKWEMESVLFQLNQPLYNIIHFFNLFMSNSEVQLEKIDVTGLLLSDEFDSRRIFTLFIIQCFTSLKHLKKFFWSCGIQIKFLNGDDSGNRMFFHPH